MQLHQLLRYTHDNVPLVIFDLKGKQITSVRTKQNIDVNLYEYDVLELALGKSDVKGCDSAIYITLVK